MLVQAWLHPLRDVPGPFWARFSRLWYLHAVSRGDFHKINVGLHQKYGEQPLQVSKSVDRTNAYGVRSGVGSVVRIAPGQYSIDDPKAMKIIYSHSSPFVKAPWYLASANSNPESYDLFTDRNPRRHSENRRKVAALYSMTSIVAMEAYVSECTSVLFQRLSELAASAQTFDLQHWMQYYAFDVIGFITLQKRFGFLDAGADQNGLIAALHSYLVYSARVGVYSEWHPTLSKLVTLLPMSGISHLQAFAEQQISTASKNLGHGRDVSVKVGQGESFLTRLLRMHSDDPSKMSKADIFTTCITNIGAGSDTTSVSLTSVIYHLMANPSIYEKLCAEIHEADKQGNLSSPYISFQEAQKLPYLQACIKEALRMHPATGLPLARVVPEGGTTLCEKFFPAGSIVGVNAWVMHSNKSVFGADAELYRPERWLESSELSSAMDRNFMAFGGGARTCIGKNISLLEIGTLVPNLIRSFHFELVDQNLEPECENVWFVKQKNIRCKVHSLQVTSDSGKNVDVNDALG
ncbi:hypothetical protein N7451_010986 [Penicillium sp. IBT 35674x]|nr:hypothetical protein N7451_010986 [Penicillium sp. IBT 35674x]